MLWPFWQQQWMKSESGEFRRFLFFPFYGRIDDPNGWEWAVLWPFISHRVEQGAGAEEWWYFWPLLGSKSGRAGSGRSFWPVCSWERRGEESEDGKGRTEFNYVSFLWPLGWYNRAHREYEKGAEGGLAGLFGGRGEGKAAGKAERVAEDRAGVRVVPLFFREWEETAGVRTGAWQVWPVVRYRQEVEGTQLEVLSLFPFRFHAEWERNFAPLFRLFEYRREANGVRSWRLLWRVVRVDKGPQEGYFGLWPLWENYRLEGKTPRRGWTLLHGLLGHERGGDYGRWRFLYFAHVESDGMKGDGEARE